jgi:hypothetical protein
MKPGGGRAKGNAAEVAVVNWLREHGYPDARRYLAGDGRQPGDIDGVPALCIDVKNQQRHAIGEWLRQAEREARSNLPVVVVKPRGETDPGKWWAVLRFEDLIGLIEEND